MTNQMLIKNAQVVVPSGILLDSDVLIIDGKIKQIAKNIINNDAKLINGKNKTLMPGFIDMHIHGAVGYDFMDANIEGNVKIAQYKAMRGCTSFLATTLTGPKEQLLGSLKAIAKTQDLNYEGAQILGVHMEGPFFNIEYKGAQNPDFISNPLIDDIKDFIDIKKGMIKLMSIAPEKEGALDAISFLSENGIISSAGHTGATCNRVFKAVENGLSHATHTFNGMRGLHHREPGVVGAVMLSDEIMAEAIFDTIHLDPNIVKLLIKVKGVDKVVFITDSMQATGLEDGEYSLGGLKVNVCDGAARLLDGSLAGSCLSMEQAFQNSVKFLNLELWDIAKLMSTNAAIELGLNKGLIKEGFDADLVLIDETNGISSTIVAGIEVYKKG